MNWSYPPRLHHHYQKNNDQFDDHFLDRFLRPLFALKWVFYNSFWGWGDGHLSQKLSSVDFIHQRNRPLPWKLYFLWTSNWNTYLSLFQDKLKFLAHRVIVKLDGMKGSFRTYKNLFLMIKFPFNIDFNSFISCRIFYFSFRCMPFTLPVA